MGNPARANVAQQNAKLVRTADLNLTDKTTTPQMLAGRITRTTASKALTTVQSYWKRNGYWGGARGERVSGSVSDSHKCSVGVSSRPEAESCHFPASVAIGTVSAVSSLAWQIKHDVSWADAGLWT